MTTGGATPPLIAHFVHRFDYGGLENGLVNLLNHLPAHAYRHEVVALSDVGAVARRISRADVRVVALHRPPGPLLLQTPQLVRLLRSIRPAIVHTRNVGTLEVQVAATIARVPVRIHGEHGWEVHDLAGSSASLLRTRRLFRRLAHYQVALSGPTEAYLRNKVGVDAHRLVHIYNGVDTIRFSPANGARVPLPGGPLWPEDAVVIGTIGRQQDVKNPRLLLDAFVALRAKRPDLCARLRLVMVGDGPEADTIRQAVGRAGAGDCVWLAGARDDVQRIYPGLDVFVLPSLAEGLSNTLLEAMACGVPCVASNVGGNPEIVDDGHTGALFRSGDVAALTRLIARYADDDVLRREHGRAGRARVLERFSLRSMVAQYDALYRRALSQAGIPVPGGPQPASTETGHASN